MVVGTFAVCIDVLHDTNPEASCVPCRDGTFSNSSGWSNEKFEDDWCTAHSHCGPGIFITGFLTSCFLESHLFLYFHTWVIVTDDVLVRKGNATHDTFCKFEQQLALMRYFTKISQDIDEISKNISGHIQSCTAMVRKILSNVFSMFHAKPWHWSLLQGCPISYL